MVKVSVDNGYLRILGKSCLRIPDTWAKLSADTGYRQKAVSAPVSMDTWGSMCHPAKLVLVGPQSTPLVRLVPWYQVT